MPRLSDVLRVQKCLRHARQAINRKEFYPRSNSPLDLVLLALISKSIITCEGVCVLVASGYFEEAFGLTGTLVDLYFTVRYISNKESFDRAERFANFFAKDYSTWIQLIDRYYPNKLVPLPRHHSETMALADLYRDPHKWTGLGDQTRQMAQEPSTFERAPDGRRVDARFDYEVIYKWTSHYVHPTVVALDSHAIELGESFSVHARKQSAKRFKHLALFNVAAVSPRFSSAA